MQHYKFETRICGSFSSGLDPLSPDLLSLALGLLEDGLALLPPLVVDPSPRHLTQQLQPLRVGGRRHLVNLTYSIAIITVLNSDTNI